MVEVLDKVTKIMQDNGAIPLESMSMSGIAVLWVRIDGKAYELKMTLAPQFDEN